MITRQCTNCIHYFRFVQSDKMICAAFPTGIPESILTGEFDHSQPFAGDRGIHYEPLDASLDD